MNEEFKNKKNSSCFCIPNTFFLDTQKIKLNTKSNYNSYYSNETWLAVAFLAKQRRKKSSMNSNFKV